MANVTATQIDDSERQYHAALLADLARLDDMRRHIQMIEGARTHWSEYLAKSYGLKDGDSVGSDGTIVRVESPA